MVSLAPREPRRPFFTTSPTRLVLDGSPTMHQSRRSPRAARRSTTALVPWWAGPSSSLVMRKAMAPLCSGWSATKRSTATIIDARLPFMSAAPRPQSMPWSSIRASKGWCCQACSGPVGTTSVCPAKHSTGPSPPRRAQKLSTSSMRIGSRAKPAASRRRIIRAWQSASRGVTEGRRINSQASSRVGERLGEEAVMGRAS